MTFRPLRHVPERVDLELHAGDYPLQLGVFALELLQALDVIALPRRTRLGICRNFRFSDVIGVFIRNLRQFAQPLRCVSHVRA